MTIEEDFDVSFIAGMALGEKQIQQNYRPVIGVHKWFARRPGTLFRGLVLAEFGNGALRDSFFRGNDLSGIRIADPFMGGGTPLIEANRAGCDVQGFDVNPMSAWIVREEIEDLDAAAYEGAARARRGQGGEGPRAAPEARTRTSPGAPSSPVRVQGSSDRKGSEALPNESGHTGGGLE